MSTDQTSEASIDLVKLLLPIWGAGLLLFFGSVAFFNEDAFRSGGSVLLLISIGVGASFLLTPWLRRSGLVALGLAGLWGVISFVLHRHDPVLLAWALAWGFVAYALPGIILTRGTISATTIRLRTSGQAKVVTTGLVLLVLFVIAAMFGFGIR